MTELFDCAAGPLTNLCFMALVPFRSFHCVRLGLATNPSKHPNFSKLQNSPISNEPGDIKHPQLISY